MVKTKVDSGLIEMVKTYLLAQDSRPMQDCVRGHSPTLTTLAISQDKLGWDCFIEGRISKLFLEAVTPALAARSRYLTPERWCRTLIGKLLQLTHKQWLFRNSHVHYKKLEGMTAAQHEEVFERVKELIWTDPAELLAKHRFLLEEDFRDLGEGSSGARLQWVASMESALKAADHVRSGKKYVGEPGTFKFTAKMSTALKPTRDGRLVYKRSRHRVTV